ncbi:MAG: S8 family serine peptidase, partial [Candidatus Muiribacteriota bacterium]
IKIIEELKKHPMVEEIVPEEKESRMPVERISTTDWTRDEFTYGLKLMGIDKIWSQYNLKGQGMIGGVVDDMPDMAHQDLAGKIVAWWDCDGNTVAKADTEEHCTHVSGTIVGGNKSGKHIGIAPEAKLVVANAFTQIPPYNYKTSDFVGAMQFILDPDGNPKTDDFPRVVNNSWSSGGVSLLKKVVAQYTRLGVIPVFAAGNSGTSGAATIAQVNSLEDVITIGAVDENSKIAYFSSLGPGVYQYWLTEKPDFCAPGYQIYSSINGNKYDSWNGTSMASPHVTGAILLILQANPDLDKKRLYNILKESTSKPATHNAKKHDYTYGWGTIDAYKAVTLALSNPKWSPAPRITYTYPDTVYFSGSLAINPDKGTLSNITVTVNGVEKLNQSLNKSFQNFKIQFSKSKLLYPPPKGTISIEDLGVGEKVFKVSVKASNGTITEKTFTYTFY